MQKHLRLFLALLVSTLLFIQTTLAQNSSPYWSLAGNSNGSNTTSKLGTTNAINLRLFTRNLERMRIETNGRVGIGTTTPSTLLDVRYSGNGQLARFNGGASQMFIGLYENSVARGYVGSYAGNNEDVDLGTTTSNTTGKVHLTIKCVPKLTLNTSGNVGIGATICTINSSLSSHVGRRTFATTVALSNGVSLESIAKMLGHSSTKMTTLYAVVSDLKLSQEMEVLASKLKHG